MLWEHHTAGVDLCSLLVPGNTARPDASQTIETMAWFTRRVGAAAFAYLVHKALRRADTVLPRRIAVAFRYPLFLCAAYSLSSSALKDRCHGTLLYMRRIYIDDYTFAQCWDPPAIRLRRLRHSLVVWCVRSAEEAWRVGWHVVSPVCVAELLKALIRRRLSPSSLWRKITRSIGSILVVQQAFRTLLYALAWCTRDVACPQWLVHGSAAVASLGFVADRRNLHAYTVYALTAAVHGVWKSRLRP